MTHCVVVVPGVLGSRLKLGEQVIWPGSVLDTFITRYKHMDQLMDPAVVPDGLIRRVFVFTQYQTLLDDLESMGFREGDTLWPCAYDWRKSNADSADTLAELLDTLAACHADAAISLVAHSLGGLIARYYLESGRFNERPGFSRVTRLITLGTPHAGAPKALGSVLGLERQAFLAPDQVKRLAGDPRYPSAYQLLPPEGQPFAWDLDPARVYQPLDVWKAPASEQLGLCQANLEAARAFHERLDPARAPVPYFCFVGTHQSTIPLVHVDLPASRIDLQVQRIDLERSGDGTVPAWSAGLPRVQALPVGGEHGTLYKNRELRATLATLLGRSGSVAPRADGEFEISLRDKIVAPGELIHGSLSFIRRDVLEGELRVERALDEDGANWVPSAEEMPIHYEGVTAENIGLLLTAPLEPGAYQVKFFPKGENAAAGDDYFFVQATEEAPPAEA